MTLIGSKLLLLGLRGSGKTSYLAALWHSVESGELPTALGSSQLQPDRQYLNQIRDNWLRFREFERTSLRNQETVSLLLQDTSTGSKFSVSVPDLSGELFRLQWATHRASRLYADFASGSSGVLLFVHPTAIKRGERIPLPSMVAPRPEPIPEPQLEIGKKTAVANAPAAPPKEWSSELAPTQVQLVELLQYLTFLRPATTSARVAVIVSAWDLIRDPQLPNSWVERHLPLLFQFLVANSEAVPFRVYGVSALGGDLRTDLARLQAEAVPSRRIRVVDKDLDSHHDLTAPIQFLLALEGSPSASE